MAGKTAAELKAELEALEAAEKSTGFGFRPGVTFAEASKLETFNREIADFQDSGVCLIDSVGEHTTKSGKNKGARWFAGKATDGGHPGGFRMEQAVAEQLKYGDNLVLVGGNRVTVDGKEGIEGAYLVKGGGLRYKISESLFNIVTA